MAKTWSRAATADQADETWVVSNFEQELLRNERPDSSIEIVLMVVDPPGSMTPFSLRRDFLFVGGFQHTPNIDAVVYFVKKIYPLVQARLPAARFYVIGDKAPPEVIALANESVITTGLQPDIRPYFDSVKTKVMFSSEAAQKQLANLFSQSHLSSHRGPRLSNDSAGFTSRDAERVGVVR